MIRPNRKIKGVSGIYQIRNTINGKMYIGRTKCFYRRYAQYLHDFKKRNIGHINEYLFNSMKKHGINNFSFEILERCSFEISPERELFWILQKKSNNKDVGYNLRLDVSGKMITDSRTSKKISDRLKEEWNNGVRQQHSNKLKESWKNRDRRAQGQQFSKSLTKYEYLVAGVPLTYRGLVTLGLSSAIQAFHKKKLNRIATFGIVVERRRIA